MEEQNGTSWKVIHSSKNDCWRTPPRLFNLLDTEFNFGLDAAATINSKLCERYMGPDHRAESCRDALSASWHSSNAVFCNPPYGRKVGRWVEKAWKESRDMKSTVVVLVMSCTDTAWWHDYAMKADEIRLLRGRVRFLREDGSKAAAAPKGSAILVFRGYVPPEGWPGGPRFVCWDTK
tara:strand:- start:1801 stop:2334 length:534 start_codon:yes stop_codon:yes gene_type:complete